MGTLANSEDPDKMLHGAAFYHGQQCLLKKLTFRENIQNNFGIYDL